MTQEGKLILLSGGGTGGHVFPAKALAEVLLSRGYRVAFATDTRGEKYLLDCPQIPHYVIDSGTYKAGLCGKIDAAFVLLKGYMQAHKLISRLKPAAVVGFGGYPSAPPLFAAQHRLIPTILHEQNAILGLANKLLRPLASALALSYDETKDVPEATKTRVTGNPVRQAIAALAASDYPLPDKKTVMTVVGGSQGAKIFSTLVPQTLAALPADCKTRLKIYQQARPEDDAQVRHIYEGSGLEVDIRPFFDNMPEIIAASHLLITRSGASTVAELTAAGRPALYVPFPWNRDLQQVFNAAQVEKAGGGWMIEEKNLTQETLSSLLEQVLSYPQSLENAARAAKTLGKPDAALRLADLVEEIAASRH